MQTVKSFLFLIAATLTQLMTFAASDELAPKLALVIGNSNYSAEAGGRLVQPEEDVETISAALQELGFTVATYQDLNYQELRKAISDHRLRIESAGKSVTSFVYYAGHGANDSEADFGGTNYIIPIGARLNSVRDLEFEAVRLGDVISSFSRASISFVVFDACRNYPFSRSFNRGNNRGFNIEREVKGTFIAFSSEPGRIAYDDSGYASSLAGALRTPGLDHRDVFSRVRREVHEATDQQQFPWFRDGVLGDVTFFDGIDPPIKRRDEETAWMRVMNANDDPKLLCEKYGLFLEQYGSGRFSEEAKQQLVRHNCDVFAEKSALSAQRFNEPDAYVSVNGGEAVSTTADRMPAASLPKGKPPYSVFKDCKWCPEMVFIPGGKFSMGSPLSEAGRDSDEGPMHSVEISSFAISRFEVSWEDWQSCLEAGFCSNEPLERRGGDQGWGRDRRPVINVSWYEADKFVLWLSQVTGESYRLPSEAEWEYAAKLGELKEEASPHPSHNSNSIHNQTKPVGSFPSNRIGMSDMKGNVWEWVSDCYAAYNHPQTRYTSRCDRRVIRGGGWKGQLRDTRSSNRGFMRGSDSANDIGFRIVREFSPR